MRPWPPPDVAILNTVEFPFGSLVARGSSAELGAAFSQSAELDVGRDWGVLDSDAGQERR